MAQTSNSDWPSVAKTAIWPGFALILIAIFFRPIGDLLRNTNDSKMALQELEVGALKLKLSPSGVARLPPPDPALATRLAKLDAADIEMLISWPSGATAMGSCKEFFPVGDAAWGPLVASYQQKTIDRWRREGKLVGLGFYSFGAPYPGERACKNGAYVEMTPEGTKAREFLLLLAANAIQLSSS